MGRRLQSIIARDRPVIDDDHVAPVVQILIWFLLTCSILSVAVQFATKRAISRRFVVADLLLFVALVLNVGQSSALLSKAGQVVGDSPEGLSDETIQRALKVLYSVDMLSILTLVATKGSVLAGLYAITPIVNQQVMIYTTSIVTILWGVSAVFAVAFQCSSPQRWNVTNSTCIDIRAVRTYSVSMNIVTDICLLVIPTFVILPIQMAWGKRLAILGSFWARIIVVAASIVQMYYIRTFTFDENFMNTTWRTVVCQEIVLATGIMTACIPFLKPFLMSLESGFLRADDENRRTANAMYGSGDKILGKSGRGDSSNYVKLKNLQSRDPSLKVQVSTDVQKET